MMKFMHLRLCCPDSWRRLEDGRWEVASPRTEVQLFYFESDLAASVLQDSPKEWIERVAEHRLGPDLETFGATFSESKSAAGWPMTLIELSVRPRGGGAAVASRLIACFQIFDALAAALVHSETPSLPRIFRSEILLVLETAHPVQAPRELVALSDLWR